MYPNKTSFARTLRRNQTDAEKVLWSKLRNSQLDGVKFRRQHQVGIFIVDFISFEKMLVIELDGGQHNTDTEQKRDRIRTDYLQQRGYSVIRFWDNELLTSVEDVLNKIHLTLTLSSEERG